ncbi:MAG TPA: NrfD/PsrC family molybdoenzyme membrane anchor subunit [Gemmatimonadales bacterium]|nr:NrfD/PsrC family molybdoenzyme membrane anchor subunit [Gemmatimonadales bacterium]
MTATTSAPDPARENALPPAPPVKAVQWEWYIPIYFWTSGIAAGSWIVGAAEDLAGARDRHVIRAARYLALGGMLAGSGLLIADLGRPERFHHMLRIVRARSAMSLGSWGLTAFGSCAGAAALLQAAEDGWLGRRPRLARLSRGAAGRALHAVGLPLAAFVGSYTGVLLGSTNTPSWARRADWLGPLFLSSALSSGLAAVGLLAESGRRRCPISGRTGNGRRSRAIARRRAERRLARAEVIALAAELALALRGRASVRALPSDAEAPRSEHLARDLTLALGLGAPLVLAVARVSRRARGVRRKRTKRHAPNHSTTARIERLTAALALAGSLALRYLVTREGLRSARTPADTWRFTETKSAERAPANRARSATDSRVRDQVPAPAVDRPARERPSLL